MVATCLAYGAVTIRGRGRPSVATTSTWRLLHYCQDAHTVVVVARETPEGHVIEKHIVASILDSDEDWARKFVDAKLDAEERAFHLNADRRSGN
jgi:hypothetical protein